MKYFTIQELSDSDTAKKMNIHNEPDKEVEKNMHQLVNVVLDPARELLGMPIRVNSGYRSKELNEVVGGAKRSYHLSGRAADITAGSISANRRLFAILRKLPHKELIWEKGGIWIHIAL